MSVIPVGYKDCSEFPVDISFHDKPSFCGGNNSIALMASGQGICNVKADSLVIRKLTLNGVDISTNRIGEKTYSLGSFPKVSKSGKHAIFELEIDKPIFGELQKVSISGEVTLLTSDALKVLPKAGIDIRKGFLIALGPYKITNVPHGQKDFDIGESLGDGVVKVFGSIFGGGSEREGDESVSLRVVGDLDSLVGLDIVSGGNVIESQGASWSGDEKTYNYYNVPKNVVTLKLRYWDNMKEISVPFKVN